MTGSTQPIFIVGCERSGTSLLRRMLNSHPSISAGPESRILPALERMERSNWESIEKFGLSLEEWHDCVRAMVGSFHGRYAELEGKPRWADKCPENALILDYVTTLYPNGQIIHIVRHPRDVIDAWRRLYGAGKGLSAARAWVRHVRAAERFASSQPPERFRSIRYEDLVARPEGTMRDLLRWLGEAWDDSVLKFGERSHAYGARPFREQLGPRALENSQVRTTSVGAGRNAYTVVPYLFVRLRGADLVKTFGYSG